MATVRSGRRVVELFRQHLQTIDDCRVALEIAEDDFRELVKKNYLAGQLLNKFWYAGGVTANDFDDWMNNSGRWSTPRPKTKIKKLLRLVSDRPVHKPPKRIRLRDPNGDNDPPLAA
jgi:hypothetical protein